MLELLGLKFGWGTAATVVGAAVVGLRARKVHKAVQLWARFALTVSNARSELSPGGKDFTQSEAEDVIEQGADALRSLSPFLSRLFGLKK